MTTSSITTNATVVALSAAIKLAWTMIRNGQRGAATISNSRFYVRSLWTLCKRIEALGLTLEAWADITGRRFGRLDEALDRAAYATCTQ